jgi:hypothetical protein
MSLPLVDTAGLGSDLNTIRAAWAEKAKDLAQWAMRLLVNRTDAWGAYVDAKDRGKVLNDGKELGSTLTRPGRRQRGKVFLDETILQEHFRANRSSSVVGLHTTSLENTSRWAAAEIDWHGPTSTAPEINVAAAIAWHKRLETYGMSPLLTDSNGKGGYHLLVIFRESIPTADAFAFGKWLVSDYRVHGMDKPPETFPKQAKIEPGKYGNWLRLPGRHHTHEHWSLAWDGERWLSGAAAADYMLSLQGDNPAGLPWYEIRTTVSASSPQTNPDPFSMRVPFAHESTSLARRIAGYMAKLPNLAEGQGRDDVAFNFAAWLVRDLQQSDEEALPWVEIWDQGNNPPKGRDRLAEIITNARTYGRNDFGCGLKSNVAMVSGTVNSQVDSVGPGGIADPSKNGRDSGEQSFHVANAEPGDDSNADHAGHTQTSEEHPESNGCEANDEQRCDDPSEDGKRPHVMLDTDEAKVGDEITKVLAADPLLFAMESRVVTPRVPDPPSRQPKKRRLLDWHWPVGIPSLVPAEPAFVRRRIAELAELWKWMVKRNGDVVPVRSHVPEWLVKQVLAWPGHIRKLVGLAIGPTLRPDGSLLNTGGYDADSRLYLASPMLGLEGLLPERPTLEDSKRAVDVLHELVQDFPFAGYGDFLRWLTMLVTTVIRHLLSQTPLGFITANVQGAGKTTLARLISIIAHGALDPIIMSWPEEGRYPGDNENEIRKRLATLLHGGATFALIDNLPRGSVFCSPVLDAFVTAAAFYDRLLGRNDGALSGGPNRCSLIITGNNVYPGGDTAARSYICRLFSTDPNPRSRPTSAFKIGDAEKYAIDHRSELLAAVLTIVRAWIHADCPRPQGESWGSFQDWVDRAVAIVRWVSGNDPIEGRANDTQSGDPEEQALQCVVALWAKALGTQPLTSGQILKKLEAAETFCENSDLMALRDSLFSLVPVGKKLPPSAPLLSHVLRSFKNRPVLFEDKVFLIVGEWDAHFKSYVFGVLPKEAVRGANWSF